MSTSVYVVLPLMALLGVVQTAVLPHFPMFGQVPMLPFLVALSWGLLHGINEGIVWGFVAGFWQDIFSIVPVGTHALLFMVAITAVLLIQQRLPSSNFFIPALLTFLATLIYLVLYTLTISLLTTPLTLQAAAALLPLTLLHTALVLPIYWLLNKTTRRPRPGRVEA